MAQQHTAQYWVQQLGMQAHPEGGYFKEVYRSAVTVPRQGLPQYFAGTRPVCTSIYFMLVGQQFSAMHRFKSDEIWHFYAGTALTIYVLHTNGTVQELALGNNPDAGESLQVVVPAGLWFGAKVNNPNGYTLAGCTVAPGFDFNDFELANRHALIKAYPQHQDLIISLTRITQ